MELFGKMFWSPSLLAVVLMSLIHSQATATTPTTNTTTTTTATTTTAAHVRNATTCSAALLECMSSNNQNDACLRAASRLSCYAGTGPSGCTVSESQVRFADLSPSYSAICNEIDNISCWTFGDCLMGTDYNQMVTAINYTVGGGPDASQSNNLTGTGFWCRYMQQTMNCVDHHTSGCGISANQRTALNSLNYWLTPTCDGNEVTVSQQCRNYVTGCMVMTQEVNGSVPCSAQLAEMTCLSNAENHGCDVKELMNITFQQLSNVHRNVCEVVNPQVPDCSALQECMGAQYYARMPGLDTMQGPPPVVYSRLLSTPFWCQHLNQTVDCFLVTASACQVPTADVNAFDTVADYVKTLCAGDRE
ncbi:uncharacterized protein LOC143301056 [Babylonia areolata]|uniref:uncharacterized protein LOC143301056 n=1 Tax=Babylonia areolata TaxID=304850 RepID=UPI003FD569E7